MSKLNRLLLVRHGETRGDSSVRFYGRTDVPLSEKGESQIRAAAGRLPGERFDCVVASPLRRSWRSAKLMAPGAPVQLENDFREIDFGRWEGLTLEEIEAQDPVLSRQWREEKWDFDFPGGERRSDFRARVARGLERLLDSGVRSALVVTHKGVVRSIAQQLVGDPLPGDQPELGAVVQVTRGSDGQWFVGRRSSGMGPGEAA